MKLVFSFFLTILFFNISFSQKEIPNISLLNSQNKTVDISSLTQNNIVVLSFWATWCLPCIKELNEISDVYEEWQEETGVSLLAISIDDNRTISRVMPTVNGNNWDYEILFDKNQDLKRALQITNIPYTIIVKNGEIVFEHTGYIPGNEDMLFEIIKEFSAK